MIRAAGEKDAKMAQSTLSGLKVVPKNVASIVHHSLASHSHFCIMLSHS